MSICHKGLLFDEVSTIHYRQHQNAVTGNKKKSSWRKNFFNSDYSKTESKDNEKIKICKWVYNNPLFPGEYRDYAKKCSCYYNSLLNNKTFFTLSFFFKEYNTIIWDKSIIHKYLALFKRFLGIIKFQILHNRKN